MAESSRDVSGHADEPVPGPRRDYVGYGRHRPRIPWPGGERIAVSFVINYEEGSEYSWPAGDGRNETIGERPYGIPDNARDLRVESVYEYGSRVGIWRLIDLFDRFQIPLTFFACAVALERNPEVAACIRELDHEPCGHGWRWVEPWTLTRDQEREQIAATIRSLESTCGQRPRGWCSRTSPSVNTRELVVEEGGFAYDSDAYNDDLPYFVNVNHKHHLVIPYTLVHNDIRYIIPQGFGSPDDFLSTARAAFDVLWEEGTTTPTMMSIGLHPRWAGQPARAAAIRDLLAHIRHQGDAWYARRIDIADHWWANAQASTDTS